MFKFEKEQKIFNIAGVQIGGQPGENPTVLIGSIFYDGQRIVEDALKGKFDRASAEDLLKRQDELSRMTGNPAIVDVVGSTEEALIKYVDFVAEVTKAPFLVDSPMPAVRIGAMRRVAEAGLLERAIYNSLDYAFKQEELNVLKEIGARSSVILAYNPKNVRPEGRVEILKGRAGQTGLLEIAEKAGVQNILIDTAVLDVPSIGIAAKAVNLVRSELGLPAGCGPANGVTTWKRLRREMRAGYESSLAGSCILNQTMGASFVLYGPIDHAGAIFPACAMADAIIAYHARALGIKPVANHPLYKIF